VGEKIPAMLIEVVKLFEDGELHRLGVKPAQGPFVIDAIQIRGTVVHMTLRLVPMRV
jgi:hypothetical protein